MDQRTSGAVVLAREVGMCAQRMGWMQDWNWCLPPTLL